MTTEQWYYRLDGKPHGPFNPVQFEKLIRVGTVSPDTEVSNDGKSWQTLRAALTPETDPADWMNAPTLLLGNAPPPLPKKADKKTAPPG